MKIQPASSPQASEYTKLLDEKRLRIEARALSRYFGHGHPSKTLEDRFVDAAFKLKDNLVHGAKKRDLRQSDFITKHHWSAGPIETISAFIDKRSVLRRKAYVMAAILEASPEACTLFLNHPNNVAIAIYQLFVAGLRSAVGLLAGGLLFLFMEVT